VIHAHSGSNFELERALVRRAPFVKTLHTLEFCPTGQRYHYLTHAICRHRAGWMCLPRIVYKRCSLSKRPTVWWRGVRRSLSSRRLHRDYPAVTVSSGFARQVAIDEGLSPDRVHVLPYFTEIPADVSPLPAQPRILFVARIYPEKGLDLLLRAAARLGPRRIGIDVVGDGPGVRPAQQLADRLGVLSEVTFHGWQQDMDSFYRRASVVVVPSRLAEPFGIVGIEAMSHARPAVAFAVGGIPDWLEHGVTGFLAAPLDVAGMAARLGELVDSPDLCRRLGQAARQRAVERFTLESHIARLTDLYRRVAHV
jgi:glycosyltransferase involved in cell wall biosynthesis